MNIPITIRITALFYRVIESEGNLAKGQIEKFNIADNQRMPSIGTRVSELLQGDKYNDIKTIWVHLGNNWFKCIGWWQ